MNNFKKKFKKKLQTLHILPVRRCDIIEYAKEINNSEYPGICVLLRQALLDFNYFGYDIKEVFPLITLENAYIYGGDCSSHACEGGWWWDDGWSGGRKRFFQWLYEQYKDDKTKIKNG